MVDIHCHILPGIDDGAADASISESMLEAAAANGIDTLFCTPHHSKRAVSELPRLIETLSATATAKGIRLLPGMEYAYSDLGSAQDALQPLGGTSFLLVDFGCPAPPPSVEELFFSLARRGFQMIAVHPERYFSDVKHCAGLAKLGVFFQLNADSILGRNGKDCRRLAERMIRAGHCHYVASDAHGGRRTFRLRECREHLTAKYGAEWVELVMEQNPQRLLRNLTPRTPDAPPGCFARLLRRR